LAVISRTEDILKNIPDRQVAGINQEDESHSSYKLQRNKLGSIKDDQNPNMFKQNQPYISPSNDDYKKVKQSIQQQTSLTGNGNAYDDILASLQSSENNI
jgi:hypothetical protein